MTEESTRMEVVDTAIPDAGALNGRFGPEHTRINPVESRTFPATLLHSGSPLLGG